MRATDKTHRPIYMTAAMAMTVLLAATVLLAQDNPELSRQAAEQGDAEAQYNLGFMYAEGRGVSKDEAEAVRWYRLGADQGFTVAQLELGLMLMLMSDAGEGVSKDEPELVRWYRLGADQGFAVAHNCGVLVREKTTLVPAARLTAIRPTGQPGFRRQFDPVKSEGFCAVRKAAYFSVQGQRGGCTRKKRGGGTPPHSLNSFFIRGLPLLFGFPRTDPEKSGETIATPPETGVPTGPV